MKKQYAYIILLIVAAILTEEAHNLFAHYPTTRLSMFPFSQDVSSIQWYIHDLGNVISNAFIALALYISVKQFSKNLSHVAIVFLIYRLAEVVTFTLWFNQFGYTALLSFLGLSMYLIISKWKKD